MSDKPISIAERLAQGLDPNLHPANDVVQTPVQVPVVPAVEVQPQPVQPVQPIQPSKPRVDKSGIELKDLVEILLRKEAREAETQEQELARHTARETQRNRNSREKDSKILLKQARCKHLKGGKKGPKTQQKDYALMYHTFVDATRSIKCLICGMKWRPEDTAEYLLRKGRKISNHTHIGWREASNMFEMSSNSPSASEVPGRMFVGDGANVANSAQQTDGSGLAYTPSVRDFDGKIVSDFEL